MTIVDASDPCHLAMVRELFREYADSLNFDLCFQNFDEELATLPGRYAPPEGALLLGLVDGEAAGCVALRPLEPSIGEMKRLWVRPAFRGQSIGRKLAEALMEEARQRGYRRMRLDSVASMSEALRLYHKLGFREVAPYTHNPVPGAIFLEKNLDA
jgi:putative acetyltransferase